MDPADFSGLGAAAVKSLAAKADADAMAAQVTAEIAARVWPQHTRDPDFLEALSLSVRDNVLAIVALLSGELKLEETNPEGAFGFADLTAELGIPVSELEHAYWVGVQSLWRLWFVQAHAEANRRGRLDELIGPPTYLIFEYIIHILGAVVARYDAVRAEILRNREDRRRAALNSILDGSDTVITHELEAMLGYRLRGAHLSLAFEVDERARAERALADLVARGRAQGSLLLLHGPGTWATWLGFAGPPGPSQLALVRQVAENAGFPIGIGLVGTGLEGLRRTCAQAVDALRLRRRYSATLAAGSPEVVEFADVRLELLMLSDETTACQFVADELGDLAAEDDRAARTRETLLAWLSTGSQAAAAARLGVHENTVRLRIRHAEEVLEDALAQRRGEILAALRLRQLLGPR
ncbi:MAG: PucR family transcriptional regulator [Sporichthyaceae bacterium]